MYLPPAFREDRLEVQHELIRAHPLGLLITAGPGGLLANPVPMLIYPAEGERGILRAHISRANQQQEELAAVAECLVVFQGPQDYISPSWYATKQQTGKVVPTWNYCTVHVWGQPQLVEDAGWLRRQLEDLTQAQEGARQQPWRVDDAPASYITGQMKGIVGIEIAITRSEGKWKLSQNRSQGDRSGVVAGLRQEGATHEPLAARVAERLNS